MQVRASWWPNENASPRKFEKLHRLALTCTSFGQGFRLENNSRILFLRVYEQSRRGAESCVLVIVIYDLLYGFNI